jgi:RNA polymerase sigma-70 factor, ECF subfamily
MAKTENEEKRLIISTLAGDLSAFEVIVKKYQGRILAHTWRLLKNEADAEDVTQETFVRFYETLGKFKKDSPIGPWIYKIATNISFDILRKNKKMTPLTYEIEDKQESNLETIIKNEEVDNLKKVLIKMPPKYKIPVISYYLKQLSYQEIARKMAIPLNTVRTRIKRGKEYLFKKLKWTKKQT